MDTTGPKRLIRGAVAAGALALVAAPVAAVNIPEGGAVTPDSVFVIHFQVQEGCDGAPTDALEVTIPAQISNPLPEAAPGWDVAVGTLDDESSDGDAEPLTVVRWTGGSLQDGAFAEFGLRARFPDEPGASIAFPVVQRCGLVERTWSGSDGDSPAPTVTLTERFGPRDLVELSDSVAALSSQIEEMDAELGTVDVPNLRSRVSDTENAIDDVMSQLDELQKQVASLQDGGE